MPERQKTSLLILPPFSHMCHVVSRESPIIFTASDPTRAIRVHYGKRSDVIMRPGITEVNDWNQED
jgi:hypothetical protein